MQVNEAWEALAKWLPVLKARTDAGDEARHLLAVLLLAVHVDVCPNERSDGASCGGINGYLCDKAPKGGSNGHNRANDGTRAD